MKKFNIYCRIYNSNKEIPQIILCGHRIDILEKMFKLLDFDPKYYIRVKTFTELEICLRDYAIIIAKYPLTVEEASSMTDSLVISHGLLLNEKEGSLRNVLHVDLDDNDMAFKIAEFIGFQGFNGVQYNAQAQIPFLYGPFNIDEKHSIVTLASRMIKEEIKWMAGGCIYRSAQKIQQLFEICKRCSAFRPDEKRPIVGRCGICGCYLMAEGRRMDNKLAMNTTECPVGNWLSDSTVTDQQIMGQEEALHQRFILRKVAFEKDVSEVRDCNCGRKVAS